MKRKTLAPILASCLVFAGCGAILEEAAEQALEQGGVEVELDDVEDGEFNITIEGEDGEQASIQVDGEEGTLQIESDDGEESVNIDAQIDEDGEFTVNVEDQDGEVAVVEGDTEEGTVEFETEDSEGTLNIDAGLPENWPAEFPLPDDATVLTSLAIDEGDESSFSAIFAGPPGSIDRYLEHFKDLATVASEVEVSSGEGRIWTIVWGTEEDPLGTVVLSETDEEIGGQIQIGGGS